MAHDPLIEARFSIEQISYKFLESQQNAGALSMRTDLERPLCAASADGANGTRAAVAVDGKRKVWQF